MQLATDEHEESHSTIEASGGWPFVSRRVRIIDGRIQAWESRKHRKGLSPLGHHRNASLLSARHLNTWVGVVFATGAACFAVASLLSLFPDFAGLSAFSIRINVLYFAGSIPFTIAAWLQLFQAANARFEANDQGRIVWFGWYPTEIGWLSCALQFVGTVLFNLNTFDAMSSSLDWLQEDLIVWVPDFVGSILFLASGYLAFVENCHAHWALRPRSLSWWIVVINLLGCIGFMISACFAFVFPGGSRDLAIAFSTAWTLQGAVCFLIGALLMPLEAMETAPA